MDNKTILWIVIGILIVLAIVALIAMMSNKKKKEEQRAEAERLRQNAAAEQAQLRRREQEAQAAAAEADKRRQEADRAAAEARKAEEKAGHAHHEASSLRQNVDEQRRKADLIDPDVETDKDGFRKDGSAPGGIDEVRDDHDGVGQDRNRDHTGAGAAAAGGVAAAGAGAYAAHRAHDDHDARDEHGLGNHDSNDSTPDAGSYGLHQHGEPRSDVLPDDIDDDVRDPALTHQMGDVDGQRHHGGTDQQGQGQVDFGDGLAGHSPHGHDGTSGVGDEHESGLAGDSWRHADDQSRHEVAGDRRFDHEGGLAGGDRNAGGAAAAGAGIAGAGVAAAHHSGDRHHDASQQSHTLADGSDERAALRDRISDEDRERYGLSDGHAADGTMGEVRGDEHHGGYDQQGHHQADFSDGLGGRSPAAGEAGAHHESGLAGGSWNEGHGDGAHVETTAPGREVDHEDGLAGPGSHQSHQATDSLFEQTRQEHQGVQQDGQGDFADESASGWGASQQNPDDHQAAGRHHVQDATGENWGDTGNERPATAQDYLGEPAGAQHRAEPGADGAQWTADQSNAQDPEWQRQDQADWHTGGHDRSPEGEGRAPLLGDHAAEAGAGPAADEPPQEHKSIGDRIRSLRDDLRGRDDQH